MRACLELEDGSRFYGVPFGAPAAVCGEVVFNTGMVGYPESLTDPSYRGQLLVMTFPLLGNYGVPRQPPVIPGIDDLESSAVQITALIVSEHCVGESSSRGAESLDRWLTAHGVPGLAGIDTRSLTQRLRNAGTMLGRLTQEGSTTGTTAWHDPLERNLVAEVSVPAPVTLGTGPRVAVIDCGCKRNITRSLVTRGFSVTILPWDHPVDPSEYDGVLISNGPGDPTQCGATIQHVKQLLETDLPVFGICLGHQILSLAAGAETYKLKFGHRGQNHPCAEVGTQQCYITSQNHGFAVRPDSLPEGWQPWFENVNDRTNEGVRHRHRPHCSVQFHPEAAPGPTDTAHLFDTFAQLVRRRAA